MTDQQMAELYFDAMELGTLGMRNRLRKWKDGSGVSRNKFYDAVRLYLEWMEADPEWSECVMLARLGAKAGGRR